MGSKPQHPLQDMSTYICFAYVLGSFQGGALIFYKNSRIFCLMQNVLLMWEQLL